MIDAEHGGKNITIHVVQEAFNQGFIQRLLVISSPKCIYSSFPADKFDPGSICFLENSANSHLGIGVMKIVGRPLGNAIENLAKGP